MLQIEVPRQMRSFKGIQGAGALLTRHPAVERIY